MTPGAGGRLRVASSVPSETFAKRVRFRARVSEQLGFPYRRDLRHPRARRKALRGLWPHAPGGAWPHSEWRLAAPGGAPAAVPAAAPGAAQAAGHSRPVTRGTHHRATPVCTVPARPRLLLLSHAPDACL